jgi:uncharacterized protein (TIGR03790 family)
MVRGAFPIGRLRTALAALAGLLCAAAPAWGQLRATEVLVVANGNIKHSVALGRYYCRHRHVPDDQLLIVRTEASADIPREAFERQIRDPIRKHLIENKLKEKVRCIVLMWGVPVRVLGQAMSDDQRQVVQAYRGAAEAIRGRMAGDVALLYKVGHSFPEPRTKGLTPLGKLFEPDAAASADLKRSVEENAKVFKTLLRGKQQRLKQIQDPDEQRIARRQLAALRLEFHGLRGFLRDYPEDDVPGLPTREALSEQAEGLEERLQQLLAGEPTKARARRIVEAVAALEGIEKAWSYCEHRLLAPNRGEDASVDSELALLWEPDYRLSGPLPNPMNWRLAAAKTRPDNVPGSVLMAARIDGPEVTDAVRIIKDSIEAEKEGLKGKFYIDAGGRYPSYDAHLFRLAKLVEKGTKIPLVLDKKPELFPPNSCPNAALYTGWYSVRKYVPAFRWSKGSVGWHIASFEAQHLRAPGSEEWCIKMIQGGVAATLGAVNEPYLAAFPYPEDFFALLLTGRFTVAECYWRTVPQSSWRLTLICDPLYNPFGTRPEISVYQLPAEMTGREKLPGLDEAPASRPADQPPSH